MKIHLLHKMVTRMSAQTLPWGGKVTCRFDQTYLEERAVIPAGVSSEKIAGAADREELGFHRLETPDDAPYFGIWYSEKLRQILTYCEGDVVWESYPKADDTGFWNGVRRHCQYHGVTPEYLETLMDSSDG